MDELINRQDLSNEIQRIYDEHYADANSQTIHDIFHAVLKRIDKAKVVDAEPVVRGHWVYDHWCEFKCSNCGEWSNSRPYKGRENYCPNCGAKMDEVSK